MIICNSFVLYWVDKVRTGRWSFVSIIANVAALSTAELRQFADQVRRRLTLQLTKGISRVLQKLCKYFKGTAISAFKIPASLVLSKNLYLSVNDSESLQNWQRLLDVFE